MILNKRDLMVIFLISDDLKVLGSLEGFSSTFKYVDLLNFIFNFLVFLPLHFKFSPIFPEKNSYIFFLERKYVFGSHNESLWELTRFGSFTRLPLPTFVRVHKNTLFFFCSVLKFLKSSSPVGSSWRHFKVITIRDNHDIPWSAIQSTFRPVDPILLQTLSEHHLRRLIFDVFITLSRICYIIVLVPR